MKAVGYIRVSPKPTSNGVSLDVQREKILMWGQLHDTEISEIIEDRDESAKDFERPGIKRILQMIERGEIDTLVTLKLDRLTRSVRDLDAWITRVREKKVRFVCIMESINTQTAGGRMVANMIAVIAQWEREVIGERTSEAIQHIQANGRHWGAPPYGYRVEAGKLIELPEEQAIVGEIKEMRRGGSTYQEISEELFITGREPRRGERFSTATIRRICKRKDPQDDLL